MQRQWIRDRKAEAKIRNHSSAQSAIVNDWNLQNEKQSKFSTYEKHFYWEMHYSIQFENENHLQLPNVRTVTELNWIELRIENIQYIGHHLLSSLPKEIKDSKHGMGIRTSADCTKLPISHLSQTKPKLFK